MLVLNAKRGHFKREKVHSVDLIKIKIFTHQKILLRKRQDSKWRKYLQYIYLIKDLYTRCPHLSSTSLPSPTQLLSAPPRVPMTTPPESEPPSAVSRPPPLPGQPHLPDR